MQYPSSLIKERGSNPHMQKKEITTLAPHGDHAPVVVAADDVRQAFRWEGLFVFTKQSAMRIMATLSKVWKSS